MAWSFPIQYFLVLFLMNWCVFSSWVFLRVLLTLFPCYLFILLFCYVLLVAIFCSKIVLFPCHSVVNISSSILPYLLVEFFHCFGKFYFVCIVLSCLDIFLVCLLSPKTSGLFPRVVCYTCAAFFCPNIFQRFSSVSSFLLVVVNFLYAFPVEFPDQVLRFCYFFSVIRSFNSVMFFVEICVSNSFIFLFLQFLLWLFSSLDFLVMSI